MRGEVGWSAAELLARRVQPADEARWLEVAKTSTFRDLRDRLEEERKKTAAEPVEPVEPVEPAAGDEPVEPAAGDEPKRTLSLTLDVEVSWYLDSAKMLMEALDAGATEAELIEYLLAEGWETMTSLMTPEQAEEAMRVVEAQEGYEEAAARWQAELARWRKEAERRCEGWRSERDWAVSVEAAPAVDLSAMSARKLDARLRKLCAELASRDLRMGDLWDRFRAADGWRRLGFATEAQYVRERLGVSLSSLKSKRSLARRAKRLPELEEAVRTGAIGYEAAHQVARVATRETVGDWIERARRRTVKHLREEIGVAELVARYRCREQPAPRPPSPEEVADVHGIEAWAKSGGHFSGKALVERTEDGGQTSGLERTEEEGQTPGLEPAAWTPGTPPRFRMPLGSRGLGRVTRTFRVTRSTHRFFREVERLYERWRPAGRTKPFVQFLVDVFWSTWRHAVKPKGAYAELHAKNRGQCCSPVCTRHDVTPHHVIKRSEGGDDEPENLMSLCTDCHLVGVHQNHMVVAGPASSPRFVLGGGLLVVQGRERRRAA